MNSYQFKFDVFLTAAQHLPNNTSMSFLKNSRLQVCTTKKLFVFQISERHNKNKTTTTTTKIIGLWGCPQLCKYILKKNNCIFCTIVKSNIVLHYIFKKLSMYNIVQVWAWKPLMHYKVTLCARLVFSCIQYYNTLEKVGFGILEKILIMIKNVNSY